MHVDITPQVLIHRPQVGHKCLPRVRSMHGSMLRESLVSGGNVSAAKPARWVRALHDWPAVLLAQKVFCVLLFCGYFVESSASNSCFSHSRTHVFHVLISYDARTFVAACSSNTAWEDRPVDEGAKTAVVRDHAPAPPQLSGSGPILIDLTLPCASASTAVTLHTQQGSVAGPNDFSAVDVRLCPHNPPRQ